MPAKDKTERISAKDFAALPVAGRGRKSAPVHVPQEPPVFEPQDMEPKGHDGQQQIVDEYLARLQASVDALVIIDHEPMGAPRMAQSDKWKKRPVVLRYFALKDAIRAACEAQGYRMGGTLTVRFELPMPPSWPKKKRDALRGQPHQQKPDIDNMGKAVADSFNEDDSHVHTMKLTKVWADVGRIIITP